MRVKVSDPAFTYGLLCSLKLASFTAAQSGRDTLEVGVPSASTPQQAELHLGHYLANWGALHPGVVAEVVNGAVRSIPLKQARDSSRPTLRRMPRQEAPRYSEVAAVIFDRDPQLARDLFQAIGEAVTLHVHEGAGTEPEIAERLTRLRAFRDALAQRLPEAT